MTFRVWGLPGSTRRPPKNCLEQRRAAARKEQNVDETLRGHLESATGKQSESKVSTGEPNLKLEDPDDRFQNRVGVYVGLCRRGNEITYLFTNTRDKTAGASMPLPTWRRLKARAEAKTSG
jgi:hypothetical protein